MSSGLRKQDAICIGLEENARVSCENGEHWVFLEPRDKLEHM